VGGGEVMRWWNCWCLLPHQLSRWSTRIQPQGPALASVLTVLIHAAFPNPPTAPPARAGDCCPCARHVLGRHAGAGGPHHAHHPPCARVSGAPRCGAQLPHPQGAVLHALRPARLVMHCYRREGWYGVCMLGGLVGRCVCALNPRSELLACWGRSLGTV